QHGEEMHKSSGNAIPFEGAAETGYWTIVRPLEKDETPEQAMKAVGDADGALELRVQEVTRKGHKVQAVMGRYPPMGADLMRWLYCRTNPATNINFGPGPANELRKTFTLKLWNSYSFLCEYAALDGFDPAASQVPVA